MLENPDIFYERYWGLPSMKLFKCCRFFVFDLRLQFKTNQYTIFIVISFLLPA